MDAQAAEISEPVGAVSAEALPRGDGDAPLALRWRWIALLALTAIAVVVVNAAELADGARAFAIEHFRAAPSCRLCKPTYPSVISLLFTASFAIVLATALAIPGIAVLIALGRRANTRPSALLGVGMASVVIMASVTGRLVGIASGTFDAPDQGLELASVLIGPALEETSKAATVLVVALLAGWRAGPRAGIALGAAAGLAVAIAEAALYVQLNVAYGDSTAYGTVIPVRLALFGLGVHVVAAAIAGAGVGAWIVGDRRRRLPLLAGCVLAATVIHGIWILIASDVMTRLALGMTPKPDFDSAEPIPMTALFVASSVTGVLILALPVLALAIAWRRTAPPPSTAPLGAAHSPSDPRRQRTGHRRASDRRSVVVALSAAGKVPGSAAIRSSSRSAAAIASVIG